MNLPLNIDWQQILLHLLNFVILAFGLYMLLYKPIKDFMDKRTAHYHQMEQEAKAKLDSAASLEAERQRQLAGIDAEISQKKAEAAKQAEEKAAADLQNAKEQAEKIISDAKATANAERERIVASAGKEIAELAADAADKLMKEAMRHE